MLLINSMQKWKTAIKTISKLCSFVSICHILRVILCMDNDSYCPLINTHD